MDKKELIKRLDSMLNRVPPGVINSSWNQAVAYKNWVVKAGKIINGGRANEALLQSLIADYQKY